MGVPGCEPLPFECCAANGLVLEKIEILENNRCKATQSGDVDSLFLSELHGIQHLAACRFEASQHFGNEARIDVGPLDCWPGRAGDLHVLNKLRRSAAPDIEITVCDVVKAEFQRLATGSLETR